MRSRHLRGPVVSAWVTVSFAAMMTGCGSDTRHCDAGDAASPDADSSSEDDAPGMVQVTGSYSNTVCATVNPISVGPDNGGSVSLSATISGSPGEGGVPAFTWSATSGTFSDPHVLDTTFFCAAPGAVTVTATVSSPGCAQSTTGIVRCSRAHG
jgi:hypothetical protein